MKKILLIPITLTALAPTISMVGCGNPEEETKFTSSVGQMSSATEGTFQLDWANGHSLTFGNNWEFTTSTGAVETVTATGGDTRPQTVSIIFSTEITENDITDGKLTFTYNDLTAKKDNITATVENICITKYPQHDYSKDYLTFEALEDGQLSCDIIDWAIPEVNLDVQYSLNDGEWTKLDLNIYDYTNYLQYKVGDTIRLKGINDYWSSYDDYGYDSSLHFTGLVNVSGNIMSLLYGDDFADKKTIPCNGGFANIFNGYISEELNFVQIRDAKNLILPATTLTDCCYLGMFECCDSLINAPALPATTLADNCYDCMFYSCKALLVAPELPATTLADYCYWKMFRYCDGLTNTPQLPATTLADHCYGCMFADCKNLVDAPLLSAKILTDSCYYSMFDNCTSLTINTEGDKDKLIFKCPETGSVLEPVLNMFAGTKGIHDDTPEPDTSYYWAEEE